MKKVMVLGATGATGSLVATQLLKSGLAIVVVVRSRSRLSQEVLKQGEIVEGEIASFSDDQLQALIQDCDACLSCLGHNLTFNGIFGQPRYLITDVVKKLTRAKTSSGGQPLKFVLMSSSGVQNRMVQEHPPMSQRLVVSILRMLLPPHRDNECAAQELISSREAQSPFEWVVVRPDTLIDKPAVTSFQVCESPIRNAIFTPGQTSRVNVAEFMCRLLKEDALWETWKGKMPVIYDLD